MKVIREAEAANPLDALASEAESLGAGPGDEGAAPGGGAPGTVDAGPVPLSNAQCIAMGLQTIREALCVIAKVKSPRDTLDDATVQTVADAVAPVLDKYGINLAGVAGDYMVELRAAVVVVPVVLAVRAALLEEIRAGRAKPIDPEPAPGPAANDG